MIRKTHTEPALRHPGGRFLFRYLPPAVGAREQAKHVQLDEALCVALIVDQILLEGDIVECSGPCGRRR
ncbi:hypothetical protein AJ87_08775 [Rhizobium yanglingense]|nr:hypothetical protein AJ87_08775 [Rhizobium yanglingense]